MERTLLALLDEPVVVDGNLVSSRTPRDLAAFARTLVTCLETPANPGAGPAAD